MSIPSLSVQPFLVKETCSVSLLERWKKLSFLSHIKKWQNDADNYIKKTKYLSKH